MDDGYSPVSILLLVGFVLLEAVFYGFGSAIQNLNEGKLEEETDNKKAVRLLEVINRPGRFVHTIQVTTHLIGMITGAVILPVQIRQLMGHVHLFGPDIVGQAASVWYKNGLWWQQALFAVVVAVCLLLIMVSFGIIIPKRLAAKEPEKWGYRTLDIVLFFTVLLLPLTKLIALLSGLVLKLLGAELTDDDDNVTEEDIMSMVNEGHEQGVLEADETEMITNIFELGDKEASDIMTHRTNMVALDGKMNLKDAVDFILKEGVNTRYPVYGEDIDDIIGILHLRDAVSCASAGDKKEWRIKDIPGLLREANFIPETRNIDTLFKEMQSKKIHMEIVVDEYGQTAGLLTMEDILEEIVGNILDEYDEEEQFVTPAEDGSYIMSGLTPLDEVMDVLEIEFAEEDSDAYDTLNGYMVSRLDRIPQEDEKPSVDFAGYRFQVLKAGNKMIESVLVKKLPEEGGEADEEKEAAGDAQKESEKEKTVKEKHDTDNKEHRGDAS
ncbi:MAG: hemolysin family protein [Enterocloster sp.]